MNHSSSERSIALATQYLANTYKRPPILFTHGKGATLYDQRGRAYLDFLGGIAVNALGYAHPRLVRALKRETGRITHISNLFHNPYQGPLAEKLAKMSGMDRVFLTNSGTEAIEAALKLARAYSNAKYGGKKTRVLALTNSFHGRTCGAVAMTWTEKYRKPFEPLVPGVDFVKFNDVADLDSKFDSSVCAIFIETIQGEGGIYPVSGEFWARARALATRHNAALVADEIQCGLGRTGRNFAYQQFTAKPDIVTVAKPLAGGLPLGAMLATERFASALSPGMHGTTFGGGPLVCAVALEFLSVLEDKKLLTNIRTRGAELRKGLEALARKYNFITEVRGEGLMLGVQLDIAGGPIVDEALNQGVIINCAHETTLRLLPPFIVTAAQVKQFLKKMDSVFSAVQKSQAKSSAEKPARLVHSGAAESPALAAAR
ncbi:MAG TPA: aspartate aminotransferase family protein [Candidatus Acidoferrales bacterium]|nr:aspartate aminotransferase family protein [Candidatus Acidoferrales bacterium]